MAAGERLSGAMLEYPSELCDEVVTTGLRHGKRGISWRISWIYIQKHPQGPEGEPNREIRGRVSGPSATSTVGCADSPTSRFLLRQLAEVERTTRPAIPSESDCELYRTI